MIDLDDLTKEELKALVITLSNDGEEQTHDPDSLMAMALANPKDARAISWRMQHPVTRIFIVAFCTLIFLGLIFALFVILSVGF